MTSSRYRCKQTPTLLPCVHPGNPGGLEHRHRCPKAESCRLLKELAGGDMHEVSPCAMPLSPKMALPPLSSWYQQTCLKLWILNMGTVAHGSLFSEHQTVLSHIYLYMCAYGYTRGFGQILQCGRRKCVQKHGEVVKWICRFEAFWKYP